jgi:hypothetical protein
MMEVRKITYEETKPFILKKHYLGRMPSISYAYGLYFNGSLRGVLTIGKPASNSLCVGICGDAYSKFVYELNRLVIDDGMPENTLSWFVGWVLKYLKRDKLILVSYADTSMNHHGYIYQATNWIYTGATKLRTDKYASNGKHSRHSDEGGSKRVVRYSKHRYVYFTDKSMKSLLNYPLLPYPKGDNSKYKLGYKKENTIVSSIRRL